MLATFEVYFLHTASFIEFDHQAHYEIPELFLLVVDQLQAGSKLSQVWNAMYLV